MWGRNSSGELGDGTTVNRSSPVQIGALTNWALASAGYAMFAIKPTVRYLGLGTMDNVGALGFDGHNANKSSPVQIGALYNWFSTFRAKTLHPRPPRSSITCPISQASGT
jgi:hypothetical protein